MRNLAVVALTQAAFRGGGGAVWASAVYVRGL